MMFGSKTRQFEIKILELERQLNEESAKRCELERQLLDERQAHYADKSSLDELKAIIEGEKRAYAELQDALRQKLQELEERDKQRDLEVSEQRRLLKLEAAAQRAKADQELNQYREQQKAQVQKNVRDIENSYRSYFSQLMQAAERVSNATAQICENYLDQDVDVAGLLSEQIKYSFVDIPVSPQNYEENKEPSFMEREGAPA